MVFLVPTAFVAGVFVGWTPSVQLPAVLDPQLQSVYDKYFTVGEIREFFFGERGAAADPSLAYYRDPFWSQWQQLQKEQLTASQKAAVSASVEKILDEAEKKGLL